MFVDLLLPLLARHDRFFVDKDAREQPVIDLIAQPAAGIVIAAVRNEDVGHTSYADCSAISLAASNRCRRLALSETVSPTRGASCGSKIVTSFSAPAEA